MKIVYHGHIYSTLFEAYGREDIKKLYGEKLKKFLIDNGKSDNETTINAIIGSIYDVDPSQGKKWLGAITEWLLAKRLEDLNTQIFEYLEYFKKLLDLNPGKFGGMAKQLAKGKMSFDQFKEFINSNSELLGKTKSQTKIEDKVGDFPKISENANYVMYKVDKWIEGRDNKHFCFQGDVDWCVKYQEYFEEYSPPYYYILDKSDGSEFALMHIDSQQLKDNRDDKIFLISDLNKIIDLILPVIEGADSIKLIHDFTALSTYINDNQEFIRSNFPRIYEAFFSQSLIETIRHSDREQILDKLNTDIDLSEHGVDIIGAFLKNGNINHLQGNANVIYKKLIDRDDINFNALIGNLPIFVQALRYESYALADVIVRSGKLDVNYIDTKGNYLIMLLINDHTIRRNRLVLDHYCTELLKKWNYSDISEGAKWYLLRSTITYGMLDSLNYIISNDINMPYDMGNTSLLIEMIRKVESNSTNDIKIILTMFNNLAKSGKADVNKVLSTQGHKLTPVKYIDMISKYMEKGNSYKILMDMKDILISEGGY